VTCTFAAQSACGLSQEFRLVPIDSVGSLDLVLTVHAQNAALVAWFHGKSHADVILPSITWTVLPSRLWCDLHACPGHA
jgi:hypothetical protein